MVFRDLRVEETGKQYGNGKEEGRRRYPWEKGTLGTVPTKGGYCMISCSTR